jgi:hypothetical protein
MPNQLPTSSVSSTSGTAGGLASGTDSIAVLACSSTGPLNTPRFLQRSTSMISTFGYGDGTEFMTHYLKRVRKMGCFVRLPSTVAGAVEWSNKDSVTGTSVITASGAAYKRVDLVWRVTTGGTIGTEGIFFEYSLNGGRTFFPARRLGTANSWAVPNVGITLAFAAGTLVVGDTFYARTSAPKWATADFAAARAALVALPQKFRAVLVIGDFNKTEADALKTEIDAFATANKRSIWLVNVRDWYGDAKLSGDPDLTFAEANPDTITRDAGSFITDGFKAGMTITVTGSASNNGTYTIATVGALVLTLDDGDDLAAEGPTAGHMITGEETEETWAAAVNANYAGFEHSRGRIGIGAGESWYTSEVYQCPMPGPRVWSFLERWMQHDVHVSPNRKSDGPLTDWTTKDENGVIVEHDSRTLELLCNERFIVGRSFIDSDGDFIAVPAAMAPSGSAFGIVPWSGVANLYEDIVQKATEEFIGDDPEIQANGTLTEEQRGLYKNFVNSQLAAELLTPKREGKRATKCTWEPATDDVLNVPNAILHGEGVLVTKGLIGSVVTAVVVNPAAE